MVCHQQQENVDTKSNDIPTGRKTGVYSELHTSESQCKGKDGRLEKAQPRETCCLSLLKLITLFQSFPVAWKMLLRFVNVF